MGHSSVDVHSSSAYLDPITKECLWLSGMANHWATPTAMTQMNSRGTDGDPSETQLKLFMNSKARSLYHKARVLVTLRWGLYLGKGLGDLGWLAVGRWFPACSNFTGSGLLSWRWPYSITLRTCYGQKAWSPVRKSLGLLSTLLHLWTEKKLQLKVRGGMPKMVSERGPWPSHIRQLRYRDVSVLQCFTDSWG